MKTGYGRFFKKLSVYVLVAISCVSFLFVSGELALRLIYADGLSFSSRGGPLVERFERDMALNQFDGPSRGPETIGPKAPNEVRLLIQGDSITWGQGVREESDLYPALLLDRLHAVNLEATAAVLARPGREIDEHLEQIHKWGDRISPDIVVYQWYINDIELDKGRRPRSDRSWRALFFHKPLINKSYLYFLLDYRLDIWLPSEKRSYSEYIEEEYFESSRSWHQVVDHLRTWSNEARRLTPRVMLVMYPYITTGPHFADIQRRIEQICRDEGIVTVDLVPWFEKWSDDYAVMHVSQFDGHPNESVHDRMSIAIFSAMRQAWPDLFHSSSVGRTPGDKDAFLPRGPSQSPRGDLAGR